MVSIWHLWSCGPTTSTESSFDLTYAMRKQYTAENTNVLDIAFSGGGAENYLFSITSPLASTDIEQGTEFPLESKAITFSYTTEGIYSADFKVTRNNGAPYIHEILTWEYDTETPDAPIISFTNSATRSLSPNLLVSSSRSSNTSGIWVSGDISTTGKTDIEGEGDWENFPITSEALPITLEAGDGLKTITAKFRNVFGTASEEGETAQILLKQTPPTDCSAVPISSTINTNKLSVKLFATDPYDTYYSVFGDVNPVVNATTFDDEDVVFIYVEPTPGAKSIYISIEDIAGNNCFQQTFDITLDPDFENEGIWVEDETYWTDTEAIVVDVFFDHFVDQEPLELKITGDVAGANTNNWIAYQQDLAMTLTPTTTGQKTIFAQYRDTNGDESYLISKRIFLKPGIEYDAGDSEVSVSNIYGADSLSIVGCAETYTDVAYAATYPCTTPAATVSVTYTFPDGPTLTKSVNP